MTQSPLTNTAGTQFVDTCSPLSKTQGFSVWEVANQIWIYLDDDLLHQLNGYFIKNNGDVTSQMMIIQHDIIQINYIHGYWIYWG